jgi:hypothetical protein
MMKRSRVGKTKGRFGRWSLFLSKHHSVVQPPQPKAGVVDRVVSSQPERSATEIQWVVLDASAPSQSSTNIFGSIADHNDGLSVPRKKSLVQGLSSTLSWSK